MVSVYINTPTTMTVATVHLQLIWSAGAYRRPDLEDSTVATVRVFRRFRTEIDD